LAAVLFVVASVLWMGLWIWTNPPGAAPDEPGHYAKAVAAGHGDLRGEPVPERALASSKAFTPANLRQIVHAFRTFAVPADVFVRTGPPCTAFRPARSYACARDTPAALPPGTTGSRAASSIVGAYPPWVYLPGGLLTRFAHSPTRAYHLARAGSALVAAALLAVAAALIAPGRGRPAVLAALAVAVTPMALFLSAEAGSNGPEVAGAVAVGAACARLSGPGEPDRRVWWLSGAGLAVAAAARPFAPAWAALGLVLALARLGPKAAWRRLRGGGAPAAAAAVLVTVGALADLLWVRALGMSSPVLWGSLAGNARRALGYLPAVARQAVGVFGWQDTRAPSALYLGWWALAAALLAAALVLATRRDRLVLLLGIVLTALLYEAVAAAVFVQNGFGMQGRYILPACVIVLVFAGDALGAAAGRPAVGTASGPASGPAVGPASGPAVGRWLGPAAAAVLALAAVGQLVAWGANAHRYAVGAYGPAWFFPAAGWAPARGWSWAVTVAVGATVIGLAAAVAAPAAGRPAPSGPAGPAGAPGAGSALEPAPVAAGGVAPWRRYRQRRLTQRHVHPEQGGRGAGRDVAPGQQGRRDHDQEGQGGGPAGG